MKTVAPRSVFLVPFFAILLAGCFDSSESVGKDSDSSGSAGAASIGSPTAAGKGTPQTLTLSRHTFKDPGSPNIPSHTVLAPKGWKTDGGAFWASPKLYRVHPSRRVTVTAPDGRMVKVSPLFAATEVVPSPEMQRLGMRPPKEGTTDSGAPVVPLPRSLEEWKAWVRKHGVVKPNPGATNIRCESIAVLPGYTKYLQKTIEPVRRKQAREGGMFGTRPFCSATAYSARFTYEHDGAKWEQLWIWGVGVVGQTEQVGRQIFWTIDPCTTFRAPAGQLNDSMPLLMAIANSVRTTPQWARMKANHVARMQQIDTEAFIERSRMQAQFSREMRQIAHQSWKTRQAAGDEGHRQFIKAIHETDDFAVPHSNDPPVQLPMHYSHVWQSENGDIVLSNDANYNPGIGSTKTWKEMERVR